MFVLRIFCSRLNGTLLCDEKNRYVKYRHVYAFACVRVWTDTRRFLFVVANNNRAIFISSVVCSDDDWKLDLFSTYAFEVETRLMMMVDVL